MFDPIAIVGRGCVLPGALTPESLWEGILAKRVSLSPVPPGHWRLDGPLPRELFPHSDHPGGQAVGGYVRGFDDHWDPSGLLLASDDLATLDPLFHWTVHCGRQALREAGFTAPLHRAGLVLGTLGYPSAGMARFAERVWSAALPEWARQAVGEDGADPRNRFSCGLAAHLTARALGLGASAFALDAACASSLYAIKAAVDRLHDGTADVMLAVAVNRADDLFLHAAFGALGAISPTGRSRPFARTADGLVPAEGAACVALMRLPDAVRADVPILAVIRGVGLANGGRGQGLLAPSEEGQERAILGTYQSAGLDPASVSLLECHATGTQLGDVVEVRAAAKVFSGAHDLPVGSVKSNLGHPVTAAGLAGLLKLIAAMRAGVRPATLGAQEPTEAFDGTVLRPLLDHEPWEGVRRAGLSTLGFGGNNAHLILDAWPPPAETRRGPSRSGQGSSTEAGGGVAGGAVTTAENADVDIAIIAIGARVGSGTSLRDLAADLFGTKPPPARRTTVDTPLPGLRFPPADLERAHAQQLLILDAAREALYGRRPPRDRTMVLVGMGCDPEVVRAAARWRAPSWSARAGTGRVPPDPALLDAFAPPLTAAGVVGTMPNIVANRLNSQFDLAGAGFSIFAEEASGLVALGLACRALRVGEADAVLVGAVDLSCEPVHEASLRALGGGKLPGDAAVALLLRRRADAERDGDPVIALVDDADLFDPDPGLTVGPGTVRAGVPVFDPVTRFGAAHAAEGLLAVAAAALAVRHRAVPRAKGQADPLLREPVAQVAIDPHGPAAPRVRVRGASPAPWVAGAFALHLFSGRDRREVLRSLADDRATEAGPCRLALVERPGDDMAVRREAARRWLLGQGERPTAMAFRERPLGGEVAFVYTNGAACYPSMGRSLLPAFPELLDETRNRRGDLTVLSEPVMASGMACPARRNLAAILLADVHTRLTRNLLGLRPDAVLGYSSGEGSALVAMDVWRDVPALVRELAESEVFTRGLVGEQRVARRAWRRLGVPDDRWVNLLVAVPAERVRAALDGEHAAFLLVVNTPELCVVGGAANACERVVRRLGGVTAIALDYDIAAHSPVLGEARDELRRLYRRPVRADDAVRFYTSTTGTPYQPTSESVADVLTGLTLDQVDFAATVRNAWDDGVRVFVEHGPRDLCSRWISATLQGRDHLAVALDGTGEGEDCLAALVRAVAELAVAGVDMDPGPVLDRLTAGRAPAAERPQVLVTPAHPPPVAAALAGIFPATLPGAPEPGAGPPREQPAPVTGLDADRAPAGGPQHVATQHVATQHVATQHVATPAESRRPERAIADGRCSTTVGGTGPRRPATVPTSTPRDHGRLRPRGEGALTLDRAQLELVATADVSQVLGDRFAALDGRVRRTRMPEPPMLLADRVLDIQGEPCSLGKGTIWTETDISRDAWYLDGCGRIPAGILVEAGQADLLLLTWLGADLRVAADRVYRLLGFDLTFHGALPGVGETVRYEIDVDGHSEHGGVHLFSFHFSCRTGGQLMLTAANGQAGYFTDEELDASQGVIWDATQDVPARGRLCPPTAATRSSFGFAEVRAFTEGRPDRCFGPDWDVTRSHLRTPRTGHGRMQLLHRVPVFDPEGGPWRRGYLRAEFSVSPQEWFFQGHFTNDPCMPGTLMFEGCLQAMAFYLAACGHTRDRDGWRFEPVPEETFRLRCRGQVTPRTRLVTYELFVSEVVGGPEPVLFADALCTVDGVKAFHVRRLGLRLVPDWPLAHWSHLGVPATQLTGEPVAPERLGGLSGHRDGRPAAVAGGRRLDYPALLSAAWGPPEQRGGRAVVRLPGPPYLFVSRIREFRADTADGGVTAEYDVPEAAWFWEQNKTPSAPFAVLAEIALQPCAWLVGQLGVPSGAAPGLRLRNLGGSMTVRKDLRPSDGIVETTARLTGMTRRGTTTVHTFTVSCRVGADLLLTMDTEFGLMPADDACWPDTPQTGPARIPPPRAHDVPLNLRTRSHDLFSRWPRRPGPMLLMIDRLVGLWPDGGTAGLGRLRAEKDVDPGDWYFRSHVFQDPVLPGSLILEGMAQLVELHMLGTEWRPGARLDRIRTGRALTWVHHGQVAPGRTRLVLDVEITGTGTDAAGHFAVADAWAWVGDTCVCQARGLGARIIQPPAVPQPPK